MSLQPFTDDFADNSSEAGFQFTFFCANCKEGYKTNFIEAKSTQKGKFLETVGGFLGAAAQIAGKYNVGYGIDKVTDVISGTHEGMSPAWRKEYDAAFKQAQVEAKAHFYRCPKCTQWVCENCWNEQENLCVQCAPREAIEVAAGRAKKKAQDIAAKVAGTQVFTGNVDETKQTLCPECGKPAGSGKFCGNCGASIEFKKCPKCGGKNPAGTAFCGNCGEKLKK
ncbi:MAG: zinc ribbon domain-containing protein [Candidatus Pacebacteria bacterium]|nr:zinc ribbon domain-containing protein [Candidatus Paceibacterota bacterium]